MSQKAPPEIVDQVINMYVEGKSDEEIQESIGLSEVKFYEIICGLGSSENLNQLAFNLAVRMGKDGTDVKDMLDLLEAKRAFQGGRPENALKFISQLSVMCKKIGITPNELVNSFTGYYKFTQIGRSSFEELEQYIAKAHVALIDLREIEGDLRREQQELLKGDLGSAN
jgi:hypothetical protein